jgi:uncharacterized membrane protein
LTAPSDQADARGVAEKNVSRIARLLHEQRHALTLAERISLAFSRVMGSLSFVAAHAVGFVLWAGWNTLAPERWQFDPYPFGLLTMVVSMEGVLVASFILVNQNRQTAQADRRDHLHLQIALLSEQENTQILRTLRALSARFQLPTSKDEPLEQDTDISLLVEEIERQVPVD